MNLVVVPLFIFILNCGIVRCDLRDNEVQEDEEKSVEEKSESVGKLYENAVDAYLEENWDECIEAFNKAIHGYKMYKRMITNCRKKCKIQAAGYTPIFAEDFDDFHFYEKKIQETLCLLSCNQDYHEVAGKKALTRVPKDIENKFVENRPYEYLHNCYYQKKSYQEAANAVFTFLATNPDHEVSRNNLRYYLSLPEVKEDQVLNLEAASFLKHYVSGVAAYEDELYEMAIEHFEKSLGSYMESEEECRIYCEGPFDQGWFPEFTSSIANHFTYCLKCKRGCSAWLNTVNGEYRRDLLPSHYNYLQFSYYKIGNLKAACSAVASFLMFQPGDETMWHNKKYYESLPKVDDSYFQPREEVKAYIKRQEYELKLLRFISDEFQSLESRLNLTKTKNYKANTSSKNHSKIFSDEKLNSTSNDTAERRKVGEKLQLIKEKELGGVNRYATDGFLNKTQCEDLLQLAHIAAVQGDGYDEHKSPHSKFEKFEGLTVGRTALLVYYGLVEPKLLQLLLTTTNAARIHVEKYFKLNQPLHLTYTHLVCRSALPGNFLPMHPSFE
ncbi:prolyl 3-hydroxylase 2-like isoform X2 [Prorops nasuta]|uniref:prolyl 3-hydroxylase 2-like isoform X2 n=1 Tax=Prorops nasuta TaxID=863751 RepID=UPI0034D0212D